MPVALDQLFKETLHEFFPEFLQLFFPAVAAQLDFERGIVFRDHELFTDFPGGSLREPDVIAEVYTKAGEPEIIVFHTEIQGNRQKDFPFRMWQYNVLVRLRTGLPVFSIALYLAPGSGSATWEEYHQDVLGERFNTFRYPIVALPEMDADKWVHLPGPAGALAAALASTMKPGKLSKARLKFEGLIKTATSEVNEARQVILSTIIETFLPLDSPSDAAEFATLVRGATVQKELEMLISPYEERGIEKGMQQGVQQGFVTGQRELLLHLLQSRFGVVSDALRTKVQSVTAPEEFKALLDRALVAPTPEELIN